MMHGDAWYARRPNARQSWGMRNEKVQQSNPRCGIDLLHKNLPGRHGRTEGNQWKSPFKVGPHRNRNVSTILDLFIMSNLSFSPWLMLRSSEFHCVSPVSACFSHADLHIITRFFHIFPSICSDFAVFPWIFPCFPYFPMGFPRDFPSPNPSMTRRPHPRRAGAAPGAGDGGGAGLGGHGELRAARPRNVRHVWKGINDKTIYYDNYML